MMEIITTKCSTLSPTVFIDKPRINSSNKKLAFIPYESIRTCIKNNYEYEIYLPHRSVFDLNVRGDDSITSSENEFIQFNWEGNTLELKPKEKYCNDYELSFSESRDDYYITVQFCRELDCQEMYTMSSDELTVSCPKELNCFPYIDQHISLPCSNIDLFMKECPNAMIIW